MEGYGERENAIQHSDLEMLTGDKSRTEKMSKEYPHVPRQLLEDFQQI